MRKTILGIMLCIMLVTMLVTTVSAVSVDEMIEKVYEMGVPYGLTSADKVKIERYFADYPVSEAEADQLVAKAEQAVAIMEEAGVTNVKESSTEQKNQLKTIANEAASIAGVSLVFTSGTVEIYRDGKLIETVTSNNGTLAYTGNTMNIVLVVSSVAIIALGLAVVARKRLANA